MKTSAYSKAGVDIDAKMKGIASIKALVRSTATRGVQNEIGAFGGFFASPGNGQSLVASTDGVGTKIKIACMAGRHDTVGQDIVNHCTDDILVHGAVPLFFMDYVGSSKFRPEVFKQIITGICIACRQNGCALLGGETAEMPGLYPEYEYDLVGTIVGVVDKKNMITGAGIRSGDVIIGLHSSGLHTNGYSLARKVIFETAGLHHDDRLPGARCSVADALLAVHRSYLKPVQLLMKRITIKGMAHITGGGFADNIARILPGKTCAVIDTAAWKVPPVFAFIKEAGKVENEEMYRVFNMGIGLTIFVSPSDVTRAMKCLATAGEKPVIVGKVETGKTPVRLTF